MYPVSNIGSATPIAIGPSGGSSDLDRKIKNDAAASMRALAAEHGRNPELAQLLVTKAKNLTAREAKRAGLIDLIAPSQEALLRELDGFHVKGPKAQTLHTAGLRISNHDMPLVYQLLEILVNPNVAYLLILIGLVGMAIELFSPGLIAPGTIGVISFLLGLYGTAQLPVTATGVLLLAFGVAMIVAEAHLPTHGILGASGVAALIAAGLVLYDTGTSAFEVSVPVVVLAGLLMGGFLGFAVERAMRARRQPARTGWEEMIGAVGEVRDPLDPVGQVFVEGALWRAELAPAAGDATQRGAEADADGRGLRRGSRVRVESVEGLTLRVRPLDGEPDATEGAAAATDKELQVGVALAIVGLLLIFALIVLASSIRILREYERGVIFRLGRLIAQKGPGLILLIPIIDRMVRVDLRTVTLTVPPQEVITKDNVTVRVNAVAYFRVIDPNRAITEVENFLVATSQISQTTLRSVLGKAELDALLSERERLNIELQQIIDEQTEPWGVKVSTVEVKDVELPADMQRAIARQAEAERERRAKIISADGEFQAAEKLAQAANIISTNPATLQLRYLQTLLDIGVNQNSTIIFPLPLDMVKPFLGFESDGKQGSGGRSREGTEPA
jgi:membrane-bound ClpP family serine protease/regulator of protease activity HflC (stomatin/prohibitin superfamily)